MTYEEALAYIHAVSWRGSHPGLSRMTELLRRLGDPHKKLKFVHVAGTNGKGSTCAMLASVLNAAGYKTGLYTSPYIVRFNERMQIGGTEIEDSALAELTEAVRPHADAMADPPTEFELITAAAMLWFEREKCDIVVLEVGLGGEFDATNVINAPEVTVITAIGYDHTQILGTTLTEIAGAKAGIIKEGVTVVSYGSEPEADAEIARVAQKMHAPVKNPDFGKIEPGPFGLYGQTFSYGTWKNLSIPLTGRYQMKNAAVALETVAVLKERGMHIEDEAVRRGLGMVRWPARFEVLSENPVFIVDGGHNRHGIIATAESIRALFPNRKIVFVMGMMADKDVEESIAIIAPLAKTVFTVRPDNPRAMSPKELADRIRATGISAEPCDSVKEGVHRAVEAAGKDGTVVALGSLYMSGDVKNCFSTTPQNPEEKKWHI